MARRSAIPRKALAAAGLLVGATLLPGTADAGRRQVVHDEILVVVNDESPVSEAIGDYYAQKRNVPDSNIFAIRTAIQDPDLGDSGHESIARGPFENNIRDPIESFLETNGLVDQIRYIVLAKGVPSFIADSCTADHTYLRDCTRASVSAELALLFSNLDGSAGVEGMRNPYYDSEKSFAEFRADNPGSPLRYLVTRLDGYQEPVDSDTGVPVDVKALIDRAKGASEATTYLVDEDPAQPDGREGGNLSMLEPAANALAASEISLVHDQSTTFVSDVDGLAGYASWGSNDKNSPGSPYYGSIDGKLYPGTFEVRSMAVTLVSTNARTFTYPPSYGQSLLADLIRLGAAGAAGHVREPTLAGVVRPHLLLRHYAHGARAGEAFWRSVPYLGWLNTYVGDPLMKAPVGSLVPDDLDGDGHVDGSDNCTLIANPAQTDSNGDGYGNLCDADVDQDGVVTTSWDAFDPNRGGPCPTEPDLEAICRTYEFGNYLDEHDLDDDGDIDKVDLSQVQTRLFLLPGPSGLAP